MVALILRRLAIPGAYLAAAIFALHPVRVESVAWITEQKNTLSAVFYLAAACWSTSASTRRGRPWSYLAALGLFVLGLLSKTVTATLPGGAAGDLLVAAGPVVVEEGRAAAGAVFPARRGGRPIHRLGGTQADRGGGAGVRAYAAGALSAGGPGDLVLLGQARSGRRTCSSSTRAGRSARRRGGNTCFRWRRCCCWPCCGRLRRRWRGPLAGLLFFVGTLFPVLGFFNVYPFRYSFVADHFQYLASLGIIALASAGVALLLERWGLWRRPAGYVFAWRCWRPWPA